MFFHRFLMAVCMSKAVTGSIIAILVYITSFTPFMVLFTLEAQLKFWHKLVAVNKMHIIIQCNKCINTFFSRAF